jgi:hypothetical protein
LSFDSCSFPCEKEEYCKIVGGLLPRILVGIFSGLGFGVRVNPEVANDVDLWVYLDGKLVLVAEILNWSVRSRLSEKRKDGIIRNLCHYNCNRVLIYTVPNSNIDDEFTENNIDTVCIGFQVLPPEFYEFFLKKGQIIRRRHESSETIEHIKHVTKNYLIKKGLL